MRFPRTLSSLIAVAAVGLVAGGCGHVNDSTPPAPEQDRQWTTDDVLSGRIARIRGPAAGGAVFASNPAIPWMSLSVAAPALVEFQDRLLMYFVGTEETGNPYLSKNRIGVAESRDGLHFRLATAAPVLTAGEPGRFDSHSVNHPHVMFADAPTGRRELWMYYAGADGSQGANLARAERIGLARSQDGVHWIREAQPVLDVDDFDSTQAASPFVLQRDGVFQMWYGAYDGTHRIAYATSSDGLKWTKHGPVRGLRGAQSGEAGPSLLFDGSTYLMFYASINLGEWTTYAATSLDGINWQAGLEGRPIVAAAPSGSFASAGLGRNSIVHLSQPLVMSGRLRAYYTGEDDTGQGVGLLEVSRGGAAAPASWTIEVPWFDERWTFRRRLEFGRRLAEVRADLPLLVDESIVDSFFWEHAAADGRDLRFTDSQGRLLQHEIELFDSVKRKLTAWIRLPAPSGTERTAVYLYHGTRRPPPVSVPLLWGPEYIGVWHGTDDPGSGATVARAGKGWLFGGTGDSPPAVIGLDSRFDGEWTIEFWIRPADAAGRDFSILQHGPDHQFHLYRHREGFLVLEQRTASGVRDVSFGHARLPADQWTHVALTASRRMVTLAVNGEVESAGRLPRSEDALPGAGLLSLGRGAYEPFEGALDEVRLSTAARSEAWLRASYLSQAGRLLEAGPVEMIERARDGSAPVVKRLK